LAAGGQCGVSRGRPHHGDQRKAQDQGCEVVADAI
jgi:hypothetical protein